MQVDRSNVIVDKNEDPFKDFGFAIVGNSLDYSSSIDEDKEEEEKKKKIEEVFFEKSIGVVRGSAEASTTSAPIIKAIVTPSTPPTHVVVITTFVQLDDEVKVQKLISSLSKLYENKKSVKSLEKTMSLQH